MEGGSGVFFNGNLENNFSWIQPNPPFTAIDKFLRAQNIVSNQEITLFNAETNNSKVPKVCSFGCVLRINNSTEGIFESSFQQETGFINGLFDQCNQDHKTLINSSSDIVDLTNESSQLTNTEKGGSPNACWIKGQWSAEEDRKLIKLVKQYGLRKWALIAEKIVGRVGKQCRERWNNHLRPDIKKDVWSEEEDKLLIEAHERIGNKWAEIAKCIPGRTENSIKNHWNATKRKQSSKRKIKRADHHLNVKQQSILLEEYIKKKYFNEEIPTFLTASYDNPHLPSSSIAVQNKKLTATSDDDFLSYFTFETYDEEMKFLKKLFVNIDSSIPTVDQINVTECHSAS